MVQFKPESKSAMVNRLTTFNMVKKAKKDNRPTPSTMAPNLFFLVALSHVLILILMVPAAQGFYTNCAGSDDSKEQGGGASVGIHGANAVSTGMHCNL